MSLVNDMLCDLEQRRGTPSETLAGARISRPTEKSAARPARGIVVFALTAMVAGSALLAYQGWDGELQHRNQILSGAMLPAVVAIDEAPQGTAVVIPLPDTSPPPLQRYRLDYQLSRLPDARRLINEKSQADVIVSTPAKPTAVRVATVAPITPQFQKPAPMDPVQQPSLSIRQADPVTTLRQKSLRALRDGRPAKAEAFLRQWVELSPTDTDSHVLLHQALQAQSRANDAERVLHNGLEHADDPSRLAVALAHSLIERGDDAAAADVLNTYRDEADADLDYLGLLAAALERTGNYTAAFDQYGYLVTRDPDDGAWWVGLAISSEALGRFDEARAAYATARRSRGLDPALVRYVGERLTHLSPNDEQ